MGGKGLEVYSSSLEIKNSQKRVNREEIWSDFCFLRDNTMVMVNGWDGEKKEILFHKINPDE